MPLTGAQYKARGLCNAFSIISVLKEEDFPFENSFKSLFREMEFTSGCVLSLEDDLRPTISKLFHENKIAANIRKLKTSFCCCGLKSRDSHLIKWH